MPTSSKSDTSVHFVDRLNKLMFRQFLNLASLGGNRLSVLMYHRVLPKPDALLIDEVHTDRFRQQLAWVSQVFNVIPLGEAIQALQANRLPRYSLCITFDDGYEDNLLHALPILKEFNCPASFFVTTAYLDGGMMWNDMVIESVRHWPEQHMNLEMLGLGRYPVDNDSNRRDTLNKLLEHFKYLPYEQRMEQVQSVLQQAARAPQRMMMNAEQVKALHESGMEIGGHTHSHPILTKLTSDSARQEIAMNREILTGITGTQPTIFAYPNGKPGRDYDATHVQLLQETGYQAAVTTSWGTSGFPQDIYQIPRFTPWDRTRQRYLLRMLHNYPKNGELCHAN